MVLALRIVGAILVVLAALPLYIGGRMLPLKPGHAYFIEWSEWLTIALWAMLAIGSLLVVTTLVIKPKTRS